MYLLYADESGTMLDSNQKHFVLAGIIVFERQSFWISKELDQIAGRFNPDDPQSVELHGSPMLAGRKHWRKYQKSDRLRAISDSLRVLAESHQSNVVIACVVKKDLVLPRDPVEYAFEQLSSRFDYFL